RSAKCVVATMATPSRLLPSRDDDGRAGPRKRRRPLARPLSVLRAVAGAQPPPLTAALSWLPAENFGTVAAGIVTFSVGFRGLTPWRSARCCVENLPKPVKATSSLLRSASVTESRNASTALAASRDARPD